MSGKYTIIAFSLGMVLALILNFAVITRTIDAQNDDASVASLYGKQRGRSYLLLIDAMMIERGIGSRQQLLHEMKQTSQEWQAMQQVAHSGSFSSVISSEVQKSDASYNALHAAVTLIIADVEINQLDISAYTTHMLKYENEYQSHMQSIGSMINAEARARTSSILLVDIFVFSLVYLASTGGLLSIIVQVVTRLKKASEAAPLPVLPVLRKE